MSEYDDRLVDLDEDVDELELLTLQDQEAAKNTFYRRPKKSPHVVLHEDHVEYKTIDDSTKIYKIDEVTLYILCEFTFIPVWLVQQWYEAFNLNGYDSIESWIKVGLAWCQPTALGVYIRPTKFLLDQMEIPEKEQIFRGLPFNLMNHTCSEEQVMFDVMMGNEYSELWNLIKAEANKFPCYHPLKIQPKANEKGTIILGENSFRENRFNPEEILQGQEQIRRDIIAQKVFSAEFSNWSLFPIVDGIDKNGKLYTQRPDLIVPIPRENGEARSCAIEMELTAKSDNRYEKIMQNYKNNDRFGKLYYLCGNDKIATRVSNAFNKVKGLGKCRLFIVSYTPPAQQLSSFSLKDIEEQKNIIKLTATYTSESNDKT